MEELAQENQKTLPLITVVTAVLNRAGSIERAMKSVLDQTYKNIEYIIIDGGSTDGTVEIIKKYAPRLGYWISEKDKNIADGMNKGIEKATGDYIIFINSDDYLFSNDVIEKVFSKSHSADILYGNFIGNFSGRPVLCNAASEEDVVGKAYQGMQLCHSAMFASAKILKKFKLDILYRISPDTDFVTKCVANGCLFERLDEVIFRVGTLGTSSDNWLAARLENWRIARKYFPGIKTNWFHGRKLVQEAVFRILKAIFSVIGVYQLARVIYRKKIRSKFPLLPKNVKSFDV